MTQYLVDKGGGKVRSLNEVQLRKALRRGKLSGLQVVRREDEPNWQPLHDLAIYREEVPVVGDARDHARWQQVRGFLIHAFVFLVVSVALLPGVAIGFWGIGLVLHGARSIGSGFALWREGKMPLLSKPTTGVVNEGVRPPWALVAPPRGPSDVPHTKVPLGLAGEGTDDTAFDPREKADQNLREGVRARLFGAPATPVTLAGRYRLRSPVGAGGMGIVYDAIDESLDRHVALKVVRPDTAVDAGRARLIREARVMARLSHPNVVTVHDVGTVDDAVFIAMEFIVGMSIRVWLETPRSTPEAVAVLLQAGEGVVAAHEAGVVHRDLKPDNVMIGDDGRVKVLDFGLAKPEDSDTGDTRDALTRSGAVVGTIRYMAPEQLRGEPATPQSDQFALGVMFYEALVGRHPYEASGTSSLQRNLLAGDRRRVPPRSDTPSLLREAIDRALAPDPADRFETLRAMLQTIERAPVNADRFAAVVAAVRRSLGHLQRDQRGTQEAALDSIESSVYTLDQAIGRLEEVLTPQHLAALDEELRSAKVAVAEAGPSADGEENARERLRLLEARQESADQAQRALDNMRNKRQRSLIELERLQLELLQAEADVPDSFDLTGPLQELQIEVEAAREVDALLAAR